MENNHLRKNSRQGTALANGDGHDELRRQNLFRGVDASIFEGNGVFPRRRLHSEGDRSMKFQPLGDRVVVEREEAKATTAGGIVLPDTAKDKPQKGKVLAVGEGRITKDGKRRELQVKVGDQVLFTSYAGDEFKIDGDKKVLLMREDDILAVIA
jgi:chaperonin GroES